MAVAGISDRTALSGIAVVSILIVGGRVKMQVLKNQVPGGGIIKYGKTKYEWQGWKMQVRKKQVQMCGGGKCKYGKMKYD